MKIKANHVTAVRILFLPLPYFLIYGRTNSRLAALIILLFLGLTDYLDGLMARREGSTPLGKLLDPIADKIFVAVTFIPLVDLSILPVWIAWPIFLREFLVTELRRFLARSTVQLKVTELAKIKTTLQMTGIGLILLTDTFPDKAVTIAFLTGVLIATVALAITLLLKEDRITSRVKVALAFEIFGLAIALAFPAKQIELIYGIVILGITLASGSQYFLVGFPACLKLGLSAVLSLALSIALPLTSVALLPWVSGIYSSLVTLIVAVEFASQGIDMWAAHEKRIELAKFKEYLITPLTLTVLVAGLFLGYDVRHVIWIFLWTSGTLSIGYLFADLWIHRRLFGHGAFSL